MTFENLIYQIQDNPKFVHEVMTFLTDEVIAPYMNAGLREFPDAPVADGSDAVASLPFITQDMLEEFSLQYIERLQKVCIRPAVCDNWWGDSYVEDKEGFWDLKLRATPPYLKVQDPDLWKVGLVEPMNYASRNDKPVVLGIDNNLFQNGPEEAIRQRVHEYMEAIETAGGRGCVYFCSLSAVTPRQNVETAIDAARQFRAGNRPWAGERRAGTPEARGETGKTRAVVLPGPGAKEPRSEEEEAAEVRLDEIFDSVMDYDDQACPALVRDALDEGVGIYRVLDDALIGDMFSSGVIFVPEMLMAARTMKAGLEVLRPILTATGEPPKGKVMLATVQGDVHDIGKNLVGMMLEGAGYEVVDLGVNASPEAILESANREDPDVVGLSALLTTSMPSMQKTVALFKERCSEHPVIVGGAPVTQTFADHIGADGYGENAPQAVETVHALVATRERARASA